MTSKKIEIVRVADRVVLDAELVTGLRPEDLIDIDRQWLPLRQRVVRRLRDAGVPQENWPESSGWNWVRKSAALKLMAIRGFGIRLDERWIGVSMINVCPLFTSEPDVELQSVDRVVALLSIDNEIVCVS